MAEASATFVSFGGGGDDVPGWVAVVGLVVLSLVVPVALGLALRFFDRRRGRAGAEAMEASRRRPDGWAYEPRLVWGAIAAATVVLATVYALG